MPNLLSRNPFHHHDQGSRTTLDLGMHENHHSPPGQSSSNANNITRNSRSFLNFMNKRQSNDSVRSEKSSDSLTTTCTPTNHHNSGGHNQANAISTHNNNLQDYSTTNTTSPKSSHSMAELKRFFRPNLHRKVSTSNTHNGRSSSTINLPLPFGHHHQQQHTHHHHHHNQQRQPYTNTEHQSHTQSAIPPSSDSTLSLSNNINIYHDDAILAQKYGKLGKLLGAGAGGSVKVLVRPSDGATFAVKEFRPRKSTESVKDYSKKCTAEFCIGSTLRHPNIIETLDIFSDSKQNKYYEVMEYCPIDFFAVVMTGKMSRAEVNCCLKQLTEGVKYLHSMGLAHRDLKLDNCVMTADGILKLIDFGSAVVFRYPMEIEVAKAHGVVGSDPYLAPEVLTSTRCYDPQCVDIWSIGIIYCCMMLKRFPWKAPRESDENFRLYCLADDVEHDYVASAKHHDELLKERRQRHQKQEEEKLALEHQSKQENIQKDEEKQEESQVASINKIVAIEDDLHESGGKINPAPTPAPTPTPTAAQVPTPVPTPIPADQPTKQTVSSPVPGSTTVAQPSSLQQQQNEVTKADPTTPAASNEEKHIQVNADPHGSSNLPERTESQTHDLKSVASHKTSGTHHKKVIHGPYRLLRLLPHASRPIMSKILEVDPMKRASLKDIYNDDWFNNILFCTMDSKKQVIRAPGHHHTLVKEENSRLETYKV